MQLVAHFLWQTRSFLSLYPQGCGLGAAFAASSCCTGGAPVSLILCIPCIVCLWASLGVELAVSRSAEEPNGTDVFLVLAWVGCPLGALTSGMQSMLYFYPGLIFWFLCSGFSLFSPRSVTQFISFLTGFHFLYKYIAFSLPF